MSHHMVPGQIMLLIEISCFPYMDQISMLNGSAAADEWVSNLLRFGLIEREPRSPPASETRARSGFGITSKGDAMIDKLCDTELPVQSWT